MEKRWIPIAAVLFVLLIFIGEALAYSSGVNSYGSSAERNGTTVDYSVSSSGTNDYSVVLLDNHGFERLGRLAVYVDEDYRGNYGKAESLVPLVNMDPGYYAEQIQRALKIRSFDNVVVCDRQGLIDYLEETKDDPKGCGIFSPSYALPGEIYSGHESDPLVEWVHNGGSLYWTGSVIGSLYYDGGELVKAEGNQTLFFGSDECVNTDTELDPDDTSSEFTRSLCLIGYDLYFGVDTSKLPIGREYRAMGCMKDHTAAYTLVKYGEGMVMQAAGYFRIEQMEDMPQIMASGVCYKSEIVSYHDGIVTRNTVSGSFDTADGDVLYVFIGKNYSVYGRAYDV